MNWMHGRMQLFHFIKQLARTHYESPELRSELAHTRKALCLNEHSCAYRKIPFKEVPGVQQGGANQRLAGQSLH